MTVLYETNCIHKWDLNVTPVADISDGKGSINMTESGCTSIATGYNNYYRYTFNGSSSYLEDSTTYLGITSGSWTIEAVIKIDTSQSGCILSRCASIGVVLYGWKFYYDATANTLVFANFYASSSPNVLLTSTKTDWVNGSTYHVFVTYDGTTYKFYWVNNGTATQAGSTISSTYPYESAPGGPYLEIGRRRDTTTSDTYYKGGIYLVRTFNEVVSDAHKQDNYWVEAYRYAIADVNAGSATAVVSPTANIPLPGVRLVPANSAVISPVANVSPVGVGPPSVTGAIVPSANIPSIGVATSSVGAVVNPSANVPLPGVSPPVTDSAVVSPLGNVPIIDVSVSPLTAVIGPIANIPLPGVRLVPADAAVISPVANVEQVDVGPPDMTALVEPTAYVPIIDVSLPDMTIIVHVRAVVPWLGVSVYRHHRAPSQILNSVPRCPGLFAPAGVRCEGLLVSRGSRNVGLLEPDMTRDTYTPEVEN